MYRQVVVWNAVSLCCVYTFVEWYSQLIYAYSLVVFSVIIQSILQFALVLISKYSQNSTEIQLELVTQNFGLRRNLHISCSRVKDGILLGEYIVDRKSVV